MSRTVGSLLAALDELDAPDLWDEIESRSLSSTPPPGVTATALEMDGGVGERHPGIASRRLLVAAAGAVVAVVVAVVALVNAGGDEQGGLDIVDSPPTVPSSVPTTTDTPTLDDTVVTSPPEEFPAGTAAETWARSGQGENPPTVVPWHGGFAVVSSGPGSRLDRVWLSDDGAVWEPAPVDDPFEPGPADLDQSYVERVVSDGEHLVVARTLSNSERSNSGRWGSEAIQIAATDDFSSWETWTLTPELPQDLPTGMSYLVELGAVDVTSGGWVATTTLVLQFDLSLLFPPELGQVFGYTANATGVRIDEEVFLAWDDLGIDYATFLEYNSSEQVGSVSRAAWGDDVAVSPGPQWQVLELFADERGGLASGGTTLTWTDNWQIWEEVPAPPGITSWSKIVRVPSGVVLAGESGIWIGEPDGSDWRPVELPRLEGRTIWDLHAFTDRVARFDGFAMIADVADYGDGVPGWFDPRMPSPDTQPELVVIASPDGERWLVEYLDLGPGLELSALYGIAATISGDRVLVDDGVDVTIYELP